MIFKLFKILNSQIINPKLTSQVMDDVNNIIEIYNDKKFNARSITNIFYGIDSPLFGRDIFGRDKRFWQKYLQIPYKELYNIVNAYLLKNL